jgi:putative transposase
LSACVLIEAHDEWQVSDRRYLSEASMAQLTPPAPTALEPRRDNTPGDNTPGDNTEVIDTTTIKTA